MKTILSAIVSATMLASCVPSSPQARIQQSPQMYHQLSPAHQDLIQRGQITRGMNPDAVYLAWGRPSNTMMGSFKGKMSERWDYSGTQPIYTSNFYGSYGYYHGRHGHGYSGIGFGPEVAYVPTHIASVWFVDHKVDAWERRN